MYYTSWIKIVAKLITVSENLLENVLPYLKGTLLEKKITDLIENTGKYQTQNITFFPREAKTDTMSFPLRNTSKVGFDSFEVNWYKNISTVIYQHKSQEK